MEREKAEVQSKVVRVKDKSKEVEKLKAYEEFRLQVRRVWA